MWDFSFTSTAQVAIACRGFYFSGPYSVNNVTTDNGASMRSAAWFRMLLYNAVDIFEPVQMKPELSAGLDPTGKMSFGGSSPLTKA